MGRGLLYELAYCDDAMSVIGHIVYSVGSLLFGRHHSHSHAFSSLHSFVEHTAPRHSQQSLLPFKYHLSIFATQ